MSYIVYVFLSSLEGKIKQNPFTNSHATISLLAILRKTQNHITVKMLNPIKLHDLLSLQLFPVLKLIEWRVNLYQLCCSQGTSLLSALPSFSHYLQRRGLTELGVEDAVELEGDDGSKHLAAARTENGFFCCYIAERSSINIWPLSDNDSDSCCSSFLCDPKTFLKKSIWIT